MTKSTIAKGIFKSILVSMCILGFFIALKTKLGISLPSYLLIFILILITPLTFKYFVGKSKDVNIVDK